MTLSNRLTEIDELVAGKLERWEELENLTNIMSSIKTPRHAEFFYGASAGKGAHHHREKMSISSICNMGCSLHFIIQAYITSHLQSADIGLITVSPTWNIDPSFLLHAKLETFFFSAFLSQFMSSKPDYQPVNFSGLFLHPKYWGV